VTALYLDGDDEITTAVGRIRAAQGPEIALVLVPGSRIGTSRINFRLLAREARDSGREVVIVTVDAAVRAMAVSAGLFAYASVADYDSRADPPSASSPVVPVRAPAPSGQRSVTGKPMAQAPRRRGRRGVALLLLLATVALSGAAAIFVLPTATITVVPRLEVVGPVSRTLVADPEAPVADLATGTVPARTVELALEARDTFDATGVKVAETAATGTVTFVNSYTLASSFIAAGSIVATASGVRFRTLAAVTVPHATFAPPAFGKASVRVEAVVAGTTGNVAVNAINKVPPAADAGLLGVANGAATSGGTHTETKQITRADVDAALAALTVGLQAQLEAVLLAPETVPAGATLIPETAAIGDARAEPAITGLPGSEVPTFALALSAAATVLAVDSAPLETLADQILQAAVPTGSQFLAGSAQRVIDPPAVQAGVVTFVVRVSGQASRPLDAEALLASVSGHPVAEARTILETFGTVTIVTWPGYVDTIPTLGGHATLTVSAPGSSATP
jgi:hypothetical protein